MRYACMHAKYWFLRGAIHLRETKSISYLHPGGQVLQHIFQAIFIKVCQQPDSICKPSPPPGLQPCTETLKLHVVLRCWMCKLQTLLKHLRHKMVTLQR